MRVNHCHCHCCCSDLDSFRKLFFFLSFFHFYFYLFYLVFFPLSKRRGDETEQPNENGQIKSWLRQNHMHPIGWNWFMISSQSHVEREWQFGKWTENMIQAPIVDSNNQTSNFIWKKTHKKKMKFKLKNSISKRSLCAPFAGELNDKIRFCLFVVVVSFFYQSAKSEKEEKINIKSISNDQT